MKKLLLILLALLLVCLSAVSCDSLPDEVKDILGIVVEIQSPDTDGTDSTDGEQSGVIHIHKYTTTVTEPTCYEQGYTTYLCECGKEYVDSLVDPTAHVNEHFDAVYPTCTENGCNAYTVCTVCGLSTREELPATGHYTTESLFYEVFENEDGTLRVSAECVLCERLADITVDPFGLAVTPENKSTLGISEYFPTVPALYHVGDEWYVIRSIGQDAFKDCTAYTEITLPSTLTTISESAFEGCTSLTEITIPEGVTDIYANAFKGCAALVTVNVPSTLKSLSEGVFMNCVKLKNITLNEGLRTIGAQTFMGCTKLSKIYIPDTVSTIGASAFEAAGVSTVIGGKGLWLIATDAFKDSKVTTFFYTGTKEEYLSITVAPGNEKLEHIPIYYYSETKESGCWHYVAPGSPQPW